VDVIILCETFSRMDINIGLPQNIDIMIQSKISWIDMYEKPIVINNNCVVHGIHFFPTIEPPCMVWILLRSLNFHQCPINKSNAPLELSQSPSQSKSLLNIRPPNFTTNCLTNTNATNIISSQTQLANQF
jgi:hypothetical protein